MASLNLASVISERAYPHILVFSGSKLLEYKANKAGYVFFLARSPEAPSTMMERGSFFSVSDSPRAGDLGGEDIADFTVVARMT